ncbi:cation-transporting P-type ATPase [Streptomyces sp. NPDC012756]|uniref:cation-transporting P-type ATPase n=1 Tax=Streptomyces sp. NPDC012756 TaxID=3364847 RepID=UPI0036B8FB84
MTEPSECAGGPRRASGDDGDPRAPAEVLRAMGIDAERGLSAARAAELLAVHRHHALSQETPDPAWRRLLGQHHGSVQLVLVATAVAPLITQAWTAAILPVGPALLNTVGGMHQERNAHMSVGGFGPVERNAIVKEPLSVETPRFTSVIISDKTDTLPMNRLTVVEVVNPIDRCTASGTDAAGSAAGGEATILPCPVAKDARSAADEVVGGMDGSPRLIGSPRTGARRSGWGTVPATLVLHVLWGLGRPLAGRVRAA